MRAIDVQFDEDNLPLTEAERAKLAGMTLTRFRHVLNKPETVIRRTEARVWLREHITDLHLVTLAKSVRSMPGIAVLWARLLMDERKMEQGQNVSEEAKEQFDKLYNFLNEGGADANQGPTGNADGDALPLPDLSDAEDQEPPRLEYAQRALPDGREDGDEHAGHGGK